MINVTREVASMANMANACGITVQLLDPDGPQQPCTNMETKEVFLPRPKWDWNDHEIKMWRSAAWHEVGHHHPTQNALIDIMKEEEISYQSPLGTVINCLDDVWQEMITTHDYAGAGKWLSYGQGELCKSSLKNYHEAIAAGRDFPAGLLPGMMLAYRARSEWQTCVKEAFPALLAAVEEGVEFEHLVDRVNNIINHPDPARECVDLSKEVVKGLGMDPETEEAKGSPSDGEGGEGAVTIEELMGHAHTLEGTVPYSDGEGEGSEGFLGHGEYIPYDLEDFITKPNCYERFLGDADMMDDLYEKSIGVSNKVCRLFQSASQTGKQYQQKRGRLTTRHLTRGAMGDPRIFNRKTERIDTKAAVYLLLDCSSSMNGRKMAASAVAVANLSKALSITGVPNKIAGFTERRPYIYHPTLKDWEETVSWKDMRDKLCRLKLAQNADGDSVMYAYNELLSSKYQRKILIVLSDGVPCCDRPGDSTRYLRNVTKHIEREKKVELYGVGIMSDTSRFYSDSVVLRTPSAIEECITEVVRDKIIRSK